MYVDQCAYINKHGMNSIYKQNAMGELSSRLRKNENNTDISIYLMYQAKAHENI